MGQLSLLAERAATNLESNVAHSNKHSGNAANEDKPSPPAFEEAIAAQAGLRQTALRQAESGASEHAAKPSKVGGAADISARELTLELERLTLQALRVTFDDINRTFFAAKLRRPVFALSATELRLGQFASESRTLEISRSLLLRWGWGSVVEVLKHEMAHQYVIEVLRIRNEPAHGPTFRRVCAERGFDARAAGAPDGDGSDFSAHASSAEQAVLQKIERLLSLAQSANEHEAQAAMNAAQRLMLKHNLEQVSQASERKYCYRHLGEPSGRTSEAQRILAGILSTYFFVDTIWVPVWRPLEGKRGSVIEACGTVANVEMADYVHSFLTHTAERLWRQHKRSHRLRKNRDHMAFLAGVMAGFRDKLASERETQQATGLVWVGDPKIKDFMKSRHPYMRYSRYVSSEKQEAHAHGRAAGSSIVLHRGVSAGPSSARKLLGPGK